MNLIDTAEAIVAHRDAHPDVMERVNMSSEPLRAMVYEYMGTDAARAIDGTPLYAQLVDELEMIY
jgi:hypothetical protein